MFIKKNEIKRKFEIYYELKSLIFTHQGNTKGNKWWWNDANKRFPGSPADFSLIVGLLQERGAVPSVAVLPQGGSRRCFWCWWSSFIFKQTWLAPFLLSANIRAVQIFSTLEENFAKNIELDENRVWAQFELTSPYILL